MKEYPYQIKTLADYKVQYNKSLSNPVEFWGQIAESFRWHRKWDNVLEWNFKEPKVRWFEGAQLNITENCLDRHVEATPNRVAMIWESNDPQEDSRTFTYAELLRAVNKCARVLIDMGVQKGDRVCIYMGMIPELAIATLACARIGAIHSVIFGGFSAQSIADRVEDAQASYIITCDGAFRGNKSIPLKAVVDEALQKTACVKKVLVYQRTGENCAMQSSRDIWWHEAMATVSAEFLPATIMDAEDMLFILYTSGSTGKPKGVVHTCAGYMVWTNYTFVNVFQYRPGQVHFCTADIGWITGHSYILYGPLNAGATTLLFEGIPTYPDAGRFWDICDKHNVNILYTAPTAIRSLMSFGETPFEGKSLQSLEVLGSVGEPINEEAWHWYQDKAGRGTLPVVDTWWQTETGGILISNLAGVTPAKPSFATLPLPGIEPVLVDENGKILEGENVSGNLCIAKPWPGMLRTTYGDHERCRTTYFSAYKDLYFTGDGCLRDENGFYRITGRVDDVLNVSGHRIGTAEVENAINLHHEVVESAVVGYPHDIKGQGIYAYVIANSDTKQDDTLRQHILNSVTKTIGAIAKPDKILFVRGLPKTRSGKIMRRILRKIAEGEYAAIGDTTTLLDPAVMEEIIQAAKGL